MADKPFDPWRRASDWAIKYGPWIIVRGVVRGENRFNLYRHEKLVSCGMSTAQEGKDYVIAQAATPGI